MQQFCLQLSSNSRPEALTKWRVTAGATIPKVPIEPSPAGYTRADSIQRRCGEVLRGKHVHELNALGRWPERLGNQRTTGYHCKAVWNILFEPEGAPAITPKCCRPAKSPTLPTGLLTSRVWNAQVLLREIRQRGYEGGCTILKKWLHPQVRPQPG